jgi:membrane-associated phospholipid phosphatase
LIGSVAVIVGHLHYSIDVFSAYFIAFGIFEIAKKIFKKEYGLTQGSY